MTIETPTPDVIRTFRDMMGWSQVDLAERLGVHRQTVARWEGGVATPPPFLRLAFLYLADGEATT